MLLTGKRALEYAGSVAAEDNNGIGGFERVMGPNGEAQYFAPDLTAAYQLLFRHLAFTQIAPGERRPRRLRSLDPVERDVTLAPYGADGEAEGYRTVGEIFDEATNPGRKRPFSIRPVMRAVLDQDVATDNFPVLGLQRPLCLNWSGTFQIEVIMYSGGGEFGVQAFAGN